MIDYGASYADVIPEQSKFYVMRRAPGSTDWGFMGASHDTAEQALRYLNGSCRPSHRGGLWKIVEMKTTFTTIEETR